MLQLGMAGVILYQGVKRKKTEETFFINREAAIGAGYVALTAALFCLIICLAGAPALASIMRVPWGILTPIIVVALVMGGCAMRNLMFDVWQVLVFGILGYIMKKLKYPLAPLAVALVLGAMTETVLRQSLIMGRGSPTLLFERPISAIVLVIAVLLFAYPFVRPLIVKAIQTIRKPKPA